MTKKLRNSNAIWIFLRIIILFVVPLILIFSTLWYDNSSSIGNDYLGSFLGVGSTRQVEGSFSIKSVLDEDIRKKLSYLIGKSLDIQTLEICGSSDVEAYQGINLSSFQNRITIEGEVKKIGYNETFCYDLDPEKENYSYQYTTEYKLLENDEYAYLNQSINWDYNIIKEAKIKPKRDILLMISIIIFIAWWILCDLIANIIVLTIKGLELKKR